jgi:deoxyribose-phosphate aldolase
MHEIAGYIEHTLLDPAATEAQIHQLCSEARKYRFFAVCVHPCHVKQVVDELDGTGIHVVTVVGFPLGANLSSTKAQEAKAAIALGADEVDMVINIGALKSRQMRCVTDDIKAVVKAAGKHKVKVIIECDLLTDEEKVLAAKACVAARAAFVKTSTGFAKNGKGATVADVRLLKSTIAGSGLGIKASAGIRDYATAIAMVEAGADRLGTSAGIAICDGAPLAF